jgi:hypothetical protein
VIDTVNAHTVSVNNNPLLEIALQSCARLQSSQGKKCVIPPNALVLGREWGGGTPELVNVVYDAVSLKTTDCVERCL